MTRAVPLLLLGFQCALMVLQGLQIGFQQPQGPFRVLRIGAGSPKPYDSPLLAPHDPSGFLYESTSFGEIVNFCTHDRYVIHKSREGISAPLTPCINCGTFSSVSFLPTATPFSLPRLWSRSARVGLSRPIELNASVTEATNAGKGKKFPAGEIFHRALSNFTPARASAPARPRAC